MEIRSEHYYTCTYSVQQSSEAMLHFDSVSVDQFVVWLLLNELSC